MAEIFSNTFTTNINKVIVAETDNNTQIIIMKNKVELTAVNSTPTTGQYRVTIAETKNCTARLENDYKTITLLTATGNSGEIKLSINIEGKKTITKIIPVASITSSSTISTHYSEHQQLANKFTWLVKSGTSSSNMELTDELFNLVSKNISLTADRIDLNGYVSNEDKSWSISKDGLFNAKDMNVSGNISCSSLNITNINSAKYPATLAGSLNIYINNSTGHDDNVIEDEAIFATLQGAIDALPKSLNSKSVRITLQNSITENINIAHFSSGDLFLYFNGYSINGHINISKCSASVSLYGGNDSNNTGNTGIVHPNLGTDLDLRTVSINIEASKWVTLHNLNVYGSDNLVSGSSTKICVACHKDASVYCNNIKIINATTGFRASDLARMQVASSSGVASSYGFQAQTGGVIGIHNAAQSGGTVSATVSDSIGQIWEANPTYEKGSSTTSGSTVEPPSGQKVLTLQSNYGNTYLSGINNSWTNDGTVRQGSYEEGNCIGCWFFGSAFSEAKWKRISRVDVTISRQTGGMPDIVQLNVKTHNYVNTPNSEPTMGTNVGTLLLDSGGTGTLTITDNSILLKLMNNEIRGFGIQSSYTNSNYAICSASMTVKIYYSEFD